MSGIEPDDVLHVPTEGGNRLAVHLHKGPVATAPVLLVLPAMGTPARFYRRLAAALNSRGLNVAVADQRAHGDSVPTMSKRVDFGYAAMVEQDLPRVYDAVHHAFRGSRIVLLGHSLGGHVAMLFAASGSRPVAGVALVAAGTVWWKAFAVGPRRLGMLAAITAVDVVTRTIGYWPGRRFGFGGTQPRTLMADWVHLGRTGRFEPRDAFADLETGLGAMALPVLSITVQNDALAPPSAAEQLLAKAPSAVVDRWRFTGSSQLARPDHFTWARFPDPVAERVARWVGTH
ncbi:alpha/beta hydrolase family protein [Cumulibacter manganitolerans]|uniref:alpha/beta hydrolase family protein n=1 Tax=Cumulibacter manganitolerans TaxID=1884992 RepID=UPI001297AA9B|nr:alpha/beta fold hydrolase [Cumulibacter manganitolerans]